MSPKKKSLQLVERRSGDKISELWPRRAHIFQIFSSNFHRKIKSAITLDREAWMMNLLITLDVKRHQRRQWSPRMTRYHAAVRSQTAPSHVAPRETIAAHAMIRALEVLKMTRRVAK